MPDSLYHRDRAKRERELAAKAVSTPARLSHQKLAEEHAVRAAQGLPDETAS